MKRLLVLVLVVAGCGGGSGAGLAALSPGLATEQPLATEEPLATEPPASNPPPGPADLSVKVTNRTSSVARNATASVTIKTTKKASCDIDVEYNSGSSTAKGLDTKTADSSGAVTWKWQVGRNTTKGKVPILITCTLGDRSGSVDTEFTVK